MIVKVNQEFWVLPDGADIWKLNPQGSVTFHDKLPTNVKLDRTDGEVKIYKIDSRKAGAARQRRFRQKMHDAGYVEARVWVHKDDVEEVKRYADKISGKRAKGH